MTEQSDICAFCRHPYHGVAAVSALDTNVDKRSAPHYCDALPDGEHYCNCDGRTQHFVVTANAFNKAEAMLKRAIEAGYDDLFPEHSITQGINAEGQPTGIWCARVYSSKLPPVASFQEFAERVGLTS